MKKILIFGCKSTGESLYHLISKNKDNDLWLYDDNMDKNLAWVEDVDKILSTFAVSEMIHTFDLILYSPSIRRDNWLLRLAKENNIPAYNEFEYCFPLLKSKSICVTGTDGKTTTMNMIGSILTEAQIKHLKAGNIGCPLSSCCDLYGEENLSLVEVSSFMLEGVCDISPDIAVVTNIAPDHLDWHGSFKNYCMAKSNLIKGMAKDSLVVINADDENSYFLNYLTGARILHFSLVEKVEGAFLRDGALYSFIDGVEEKIVDTNVLNIFGVHNYANALCAIIVAKRLGIDSKVIREALKNFSGVSHRLQKLFCVDGVLFVNDSKSTNVHSAKSAIDAFALDNLCILIGGRKKQEDYHELFSDANFGDNRHYIFFGESGKELYDLARLSGIKNIWREDTLRDAIKMGFFLMKKQGGVLLLSPACASFDCYHNYEERGEHFCQIATEIKNEMENI